ncbi:hypothetical protein ACE3NQ_21145 [Paenibacillus terreus]|uniref:Uncharacterized protein n=1 Tax=Paenibacillus terreus TaxID=1387834 RepID=A0ABV5BD86_9BACL
MTRKQEQPKDTSKHIPGKLNQLVKWNKRPFLDMMIDNETPAKELVKWCKDNEFPISLPTMYSYMKLCSEAVAHGITVELLQSKLHEESMERKMDGMKKAYTKAHQQRKEKRAQTKVKINQELAGQDSAKRIRHDLELLDEVIQRGFDNLCKMDVISPVAALKAIELKHKLFNGGTGGHTIYGLEEIRLREAARNEAIIAVIKEYIPENQWPEILQRMEHVTREFYESIGLGEAYAQMETRETILSDAGSRRGERL